MKYNHVSSQILNFRFRFKAATQNVCIKYSCNWNK